MAALAAAILALAHTAPANAAVGNGGSSSGGSASCTGGGINGCPWTSNGRGWFIIPVNDPNAPQGNGYWSVANSTCTSPSENATHVIAFVIRTGERTLRDGWIYQWNPSKYGWDEDVGNISTDQAYNMFLEVPAWQRAGYTFGSNVGWFCYNSNPPFSIRAESYIRRSGSSFVQSNLTVKPGDRIQFAHDLRAQNDIHKRIYYTIRSSGFPDGFRMMGQSWSSPTTIYHSNVAPVISNNSLFVNFNPDTGNGSYMTYDVQQSDVGNNLCQRIEYAPTTQSNNNSSATAFRCANVPYSYTLTPQITGMTDNAMIESATGPIDVRGVVSNSGDTRSHPNIQWQLTQAVYDAGDPIPNRGGGVNANDPCDYFSGTRSCGAVPNGAANVAGGYSHNQTVPYDRQGTVGDYPVGTRICFAMSVKRNSSSSSDWRHSRMFCRVVGKEPKVQVLGGDLVVGRGTAFNDPRSSDVMTSASQQLAGNYYGSWVEYGIIASGRVNDMASGSLYADGSPTNIMCSLSYLTFTNGGNPTCSNANIGRYTHTTTSPNIAGRFPITSSTPRITTAGVTLGDGANPMQGVYTTNQSALSVFGGAPIAVGQWVVINAPETDVTVSSDIFYTDAALLSVRQIPQVVIIAKNIYVSDGVSNIDSWLVATGSDVGGVQNGIINTCGAGGVTPATLPSSQQCGTKLTVNGPVSANHLYLRRTAGAGTGTAAGDPAEVLNLRADAYIWASNYAPGTGRLPSVLTTELPPRF